MNYTGSFFFIVQLHLLYNTQNHQTQRGSHPRSCLHLYVKWKSSVSPPSPAESPLLSAPLTTFMALSSSFLRPATVTHVSRTAAPSPRCRVTSTHTHLHTHTHTVLFTASTVYRETHTTCQPLSLEQCPLPLCLTL